MCFIMVLSFMLGLSNALMDVRMVVPGSQLRAKHCGKVTLNNLSRYLKVLTSNVTKSNCKILISNFEGFWIMARIMVTRRTMKSITVLKFKVTCIVYFLVLPTALTTMNKYFYFLNRFLLLELDIVT